MMIQIICTTIIEVKIVIPSVFADNRGFFMESWNKQNFSVISDTEFVQDNHSRSKKGVVRGLHYQLPPYAQAKLVRCIQGKIFDVAVDIRRSSQTFGKWVGVELSAENKRQLWIPEGFAHGFVALSDFAEVFYKTNNFWNKQSERSIRWDDADIGIQWPLEVSPCLSEKDLLAPSFKDAIVFG